MSKKQVTQKAIAKAAGVSQTVVSFVLNNSYDVAITEETRKRVLETARKLGYVPPSPIQNPAHLHNTIGLVLITPHSQVMRDPFIPNVMTGMGNVSLEKSYSLLVEHIHRVEDLPKIRNRLRNKEISGLVMNNFLEAAEFIKPLVDEGFPIVLLERVKEEFEDIHTVNINHLGGVHQLAQHLIKLGHERIACIPYTGFEDDQIRRRFAKFQEIAGNRLEKRYVRSGQFEPETAYEAMKAILKERPLPTAVYGMNDLMALGAIHAIHEAGLRIPEDIAVVGYDDMRFAAFTSPALSTVQAPEVEVGEEAAKMLLKMIDGTKIENPHLSLEAELIVRGSCGGRRRTG